MHCRSLRSSIDLFMHVGAVTAKYLCMCHRSNPLKKLPQTVMLGHQLSWLRILWFSSVPLGKCWDSTSGQAITTTTSLTIHSWIIVPFSGNQNCAFGILTRLVCVYITIYFSAEFPSLLVLHCYFLRSMHFEKLFGIFSSLRFSAAHSPCMYHISILFFFCVLFLTPFD